jgi:hypothetical protein
MPRTTEEIEQDFFARAIAEEDNSQHPGEPTLTGIVRVLIHDLVELTQEVEAIREAHSLD